MIRDYSIYEMNEKEKLLFYSAGYAAIALVLFLFYHRVVISIIGGLLVVKLRPFYEKHRMAFGVLIRVGTCVRGMELQLRIVEE